MHVRWQPDPTLPRSGLECGHGVGFCRGALADSADARLLVAFVDGFGWLHEGADAVVRYAPDRVPAGAAFKSWQHEVEAVLRRRELNGESGAGWCWAANA
jgi:hypothetical protein